MSERRVGLVVVGDSVHAVDALVPSSGPIVLQSDQTWKLQTGPREAAYDTLYRLCGNYLREHGIRRVVVKASALAQSGVKKAHLESAEVRGVVIAAAASVCPVVTIAKASLSKTFGDRKVDEYLADDGFWDTELTGGKLRKISREGALLLLAARSRK